MQEQIVEAYSSGIGVMELSSIYRLHRSTVQRILKKSGIVLRKSTPRLKYNTKFFEIFTPESAYWAGFIAADGHVRSNRNALSIKLSLIDASHLDKFKEAIGFRGNVHYAESYAYIDICGKWVTEPLERNFSITGRKTHTLEFPSLPDNVLNHFIRGYFDGDGGISFSTVANISFTCASPRFMGHLQHVFRHVVGVQLNGKNEYPPIQNGVQISYNGKNAKKILDWLYNGSTKRSRLDRKYDKMCRLFH